MVHDDDTSSPETRTIKTNDMLARGNLIRPSQEIYDLIVAEAYPGRGPGAVQDALRQVHGKTVSLESVVYVLNDVRKAAERPGGMP